mmetsp:Transcript_17688/g.20444  ORF Transcript_17688/g.20444 Transcript_17688/m.20444 type:complete len:179 (-) Transcript_17688:44-580(-)
MSETDDPRKRKKKALNYDMLSKESLNILASFTDYLLDSDTSVYEFFDGVIYNQVVRTKNKQSTVEIISSDEFFNKIKSDKAFLKLLNIQNFSEKEEENMCIFLCLDSNYKNLLLVKKIIKALEELSHNEVLRIRAGVSKGEETIPEERLIAGSNDDVFVVHGDNSRRVKNELETIDED